MKKAIILAMLFAVSGCSLLGSSPKKQHVPDRSPCSCNELTNYININV